MKMGEWFRKAELFVRAHAGGFDGGEFQRLFDRDGNELPVPPSGEIAVGASPVYAEMPTPSSLTGRRSDIGQAAVQDDSARQQAGSASRSASARVILWVGSSTTG